MKCPRILKDLLLAIISGLASAALLAWTQPGRWFPGWLACSAVLVPGIYLLIVLWRWAGAGKRLAWLLVLALLLRVGVGVWLAWILPVAGSGSENQLAGYVFYDSYHRDSQAWVLADSQDPLWLAFSKSYSMDQYGGLLWTSAAAYRILSPDAHRPLLVVLLAAWTATAGVALAWKAAWQAWGSKMAAPMALLLAVYPESVLQGSAQMREPFLITFVCMAFLGAVTWPRSRRSAALWSVAGFTGMLLFSPGVAVFTLMVLAGWLWLRSTHKRISWPAVLIGAGVLVLALILLSAGLARGNLAGRSPFEVLISWLHLSAAWDISLLKENSLWVFEILDTLPGWLELPFVALYGVARPVLPAAIADPTYWPWKIIEILRAAGWYALAPLLVYSLIAILRSPTQERSAWLWLWITTWTWIFLSAVRAGADGWDNPRYRVMFLFLQAALAIFAWTQARTNHDPWLGRVLLMEGIFLTFFSHWYASRYSQAFGKLPFGVMVICILILSALVIFGGWWLDRHRSRQPRA